MLSDEITAEVGIVEHVFSFTEMQLYYFEGYTLSLLN